MLNCGCQIIRAAAESMLMLRGRAMLVQVNWTNNRYDYVKDFMLDSLIEAGVVARFLRSSGWVTIGVDPIRAKSNQYEYNGSERRTLQHLTASD
jgi:hypothetical protein